LKHLMLLLSWKILTSLGGILAFGQGTVRKP